MALFSPGFADTLRYQRERKRFRTATGVQNPTRDMVAEYLQRGAQQAGAPPAPARMPMGASEESLPDLDMLNANQITEMLRKRAFGKDRMRMNNAIRSRMIARNLGRPRRPMEEMP